MISRGSSGLPVAPLLKRVVFTQSQIELPKDQRQENVKDAFAFVRFPVPGSRFPVVVLVDDVSTTGATLEPARGVEERGVKEVRALTAARVVNERVA